MHTNVCIGYFVEILEAFHENLDCVAFKKPDKKDSCKACNSWANFEKENKANQSLEAKRRAV